MKIAIGSDHAGFAYKQTIKEHLVRNGHEVIDFGTDSDESCDYPDFIHPTTKAVASGDCDCGIVLGGSGNGEAMAANKVKNIRCALCWDTHSTKLSREHNDANMISLGQRMITIETAIKIVDTWLTIPFDGGRHQRRIQKIEQI